MAWEPLKTDYVDAVFDGLRKYQQIVNADNTLSFADVTSYTVKEGSFIGAKDINAMNTAMNLIMAALNNGTSLYDVFTEFFKNQQALFEETAGEYNDGFEQYLADLRTQVEAQCTQLETDYTEEITKFEDNQETVFNTWFDLIKGQLSTDAAGKLQQEVIDLTDRLAKAEAENEELRTMLITGYIYASVSDSDGNTICTNEDEELVADWILATKEGEVRIVTGTNQRAEPEPISEDDIEDVLENGTAEDDADDEQAISASEIDEIVNN
jgi:hypothetical protein